MAATDDVQLLIDFGVFSEEGLSKLANLIRGVQALGGGGGSFSPTPAKRRGRPPASGRGPGRPPKAATNGAGKRGPRSKFTATKEDLAKFKEQGMTAKAIGEKLGVSMATVNLHLKKHGLTNPRKGRPAKAKK